MKKVRNGVIYGLRCPESGYIRYIGQTLGSVNKRLKRHIREACKEKIRYTHKERWLRALHFNNTIHLLRAEILESIECTTPETYDLLDHMEIRWISKFRETGHLTNTADGGRSGRGMSGSMHPNFGKNLSETTKAKIRDTKIGQSNPMFGIKRPMSEEIKAKISRSLKKSNNLKTSRNDDSYRSKMRNINIRKTLLVDLDGNYVALYNSCKEISEAFGVTYSTVKNARRFNSIFQKIYRVIYANDFKAIQIPENVASPLE